MGVRASIPVLSLLGLESVGFSFRVCPKKIKKGVL